MSTFLLSSTIFLTGFGYPLQNWDTTGFLLYSLERQIQLRIFSTYLYTSSLPFYPSRKSGRQKYYINLNLSAVNEMIFFKLKNSLCSDFSK